MQCKIEFKASEPDRGDLADTKYDGKAVPGRVATAMTPIRQ